LYDLIEKTNLAKTEDSYVYAMAISELQQFLALRQQHATPEAYYNTFNGRTDISKNIGMALGHHPLLLNYVANELYQKEYAKCDAMEKPIVEADNLERLLAYAFIHFVGASCTVLLDGTNQYPKTMAQALKYVQNCATTPPVSSTSEGVAFTQKGGKGKGSKNRTNTNNNSTPADMPKSANKECNICYAIGHAAFHCPLKTASKEDKAAAQAANKAANSSKPTAKAATEADDRSVQTQLLELQQTVDTMEHKRNGTGDDDGTTLFQHHIFTTVDQPTGVTSKAYQFVNSNKLDLNLRNVILLDSQSTLDLFCNSKLVWNIHKSHVQIRLQSKGGTMTLRHKAQVEGYHLDVWFDKDAITNICMSSRHCWRHAPSDSALQTPLILKLHYRMPNVITEIAPISLSC
jgi:hypothetical protein